MQLNSQQMPRSGVGLSLVLVGLLTAAYAVPLVSFKSVATLVYLVLFVFVLYRYWASKVDTPLAFAAAITSVCAYFCIIGSVSFYLANLSTPVVWILGFVAALSPLLLERIHKTPIVTPDEDDLNIRSWILSCVSAANAFAVISIVAARATIDSSQSPWPHLPAAVFILFGIAFFAAMSIAIYEKEQIPLLLISLLLAAALCVVTVIYPLGYGFDPAIHQATEQLLLDTGTITPKPLFYLGQYSLVTILATFSGIPIPPMDAYLTLVLAILLIPLLLRSLAYSYQRAWRNVLPLLFFILPYPYLIQSTPQSLSFLFSLLTVFLIAIRQNMPTLPFSLIFIPALVALSFHPLTGLPALGAAILFFTLTNVRLQQKKQRVLTALISIALLAMVPASIAIASFFSSELTLTFRFAMPELTLLTPRVLLQRIVRFDDILYTGYGLLLLLLTIAGVIGIRLQLQQPNQRHRLFLPWCAALIALSALLMSILFSFNFARAEQNTYALRLIILAGIFLYPVIFLGILWFIQRMQRTNAVVFFVGSILIVSGAMVTWYISYPRFDTLVQNKGYTTSLTDYTTVRWIDGDAGVTPYIVLTNQSVSAAAVKEFGFAHYVNGMFYYPLPTNGPLHGYFLKVMNPTLSIPETIAATRKETGVNRIYVVLNDYWSEAETLGVKLSANASQKVNLDNNSVFIFE